MPKGAISRTIIRNDEPIDRLVHAARQGGVTLVVGAGVSISRGIPKWDELAAELWQRVFPSLPSPLTGLSQGQSQKTVPQFLPIIFELAYRERGEAKFFQVLQKCLYAKAKYPAQDRRFAKSKESLAVLARVIVNESNRLRPRRVDAVITFNADDLIEQAVAEAAYHLEIHDKRAVLSIKRSTHFLPTEFGESNRIPLYHIHGFVPSPPRDPVQTVRKDVYKIYEHMLVFTDVQYWSTSAGAMSFANRIMATALSESRCIFIGLSMTDINLLRWLALRTLERDRDETEGLQRAKWTKSGFEKSIGRQFRRHFWIRPASDDPSGFLSEFLKLRGVEAIEIPDWSGDSFSRLMRKCFP
jgi:hypothetical protein